MKPGKGHESFGLPMGTRLCSCTDMQICRLVANKTQKFVPKQHSEVPTRQAQKGNHEASLVQPPLSLLEMPALESSSAHMHP